MVVLKVKNHPMYSNSFLFLTPYVVIFLFHFSCTSSFSSFLSFFSFLRVVDMNEFNESSPEISYSLRDRSPYSVMEYISK